MRPQPKTPVQPFNFFGARGVLTHSLLGRYSRWLHRQLLERWPEAKEPMLQPFPVISNKTCMTGTFLRFRQWAGVAVKPYVPRVDVLSGGGVFGDDRFEKDPESKGHTVPLPRLGNPVGVRWVRDLRALDAWLMARIKEKDEVKEQITYLEGV